jgi:hypothetical protein
LPRHYHTLAGAEAIDIYALLPATRFDSYLMATLMLMGRHFHIARLADVRAAIARRDDYSFAAGDAFTSAPAQFSC